jgi:hypothetical protein
MHLFCCICGPLIGRPDEGDAGNNTLQQLEFGDLPMFEDVAFPPVASPSVDNTLLVGVELVERS